MENTPVSLEEQISEYIILDRHIKQATKKADELKAIIKEGMKAMDMSKVEMGDDVVECYTQDRKTLVEDKALDYIKKRNFTDCIIMKEALDESKVIEKISDGEIDVDDFEKSCYNHTVVTALKVTKKKKEAKKIKL